MKKNTHTIKYHNYMYIFMLSIYTCIKEILRSLTISYSIYSEEIHINCVVFEMDSCTSQASSMGV